MCRRRRPALWSGRDPPPNENCSFKCHLHHHFAYPCSRGSAIMFCGGATVPSPFCTPGRGWGGAGDEVHDQENQHTDIWQCAERRGVEGEPGKHPSNILYKPPSIHERSPVKHLQSFPRLNTNTSVRKAACGKHPFSLVYTATKTWEKVVSKTC